MRRIINVCDLCDREEGGELDRYAQHPSPTDWLEIGASMQIPVARERIAPPRLPSTARRIIE